MEEWPSGPDASMQAFGGFQKKPRNHEGSQFLVRDSEHYGRVAEWLKATVLKTVMGQPIGGSNPSSSAQKLIIYNVYMERWLSG